MNMRSFVASAVVIAAFFVVVCVSVEYIPPKRKCAWNVELKLSSSNDRIVYYINGRYLKREYYSYIRDEQSERLERISILRPDLQNVTFVYTSGSCETVDSIHYWEVHSQLLDALQSPSTFPNCFDSELNGKPATEYRSQNLSIWVDKSGNPIGIQCAATQYIASLDFGSRAPLSVFSLKKGETGGCSPQGIYEDASDDFVMCAATFTKVSLSVIIALIGALLYVF